MMAICSELRIPLFVVGKPGSSKSLAKDVISTNMQGNSSKSRLFKNLKRVRLIRMPPIDFNTNYNINILLAY